MEATQINKIKDLRQSESWSKYLNWLGWETKETSSGNKIYFLKMPFGKIAKIQRAKNISAEELVEIEQICKSNKTLFIKIEPSLEQDLNILENLQKSPFPLIPPSTILIDLTKPEEDLWKAISKSGKYSINRAKREGAVVEIFQSPNEKIIKEFYEIVKQTGSTKNFYTAKLEDYLKKPEIFGEECFVLHVKNKETSEIMGSHMYLGFEKNIWYLHGGTSDTGRKGKWGYELYWQSFLEFKKLGYRYLDLEGKDDDRFPNFTKNWGGFSHFKEKFGGIEIEFPEPRIIVFNRILKKLTKLQPL